LNILFALALARFPLSLLLLDDDDTDIYTLCNMPAAGRRTLATTYDGMGEPSDYLHTTMFTYLYCFNHQIPNLFIIFDLDQPAPETTRRNQLQRRMPTFTFPDPPSSVSLDA